MLTETKEIPAKEQILNYEIVHVLQQKLNGKWRAEVQTNVTDKDGTIVETIVQKYEDENYNGWWSTYNSGKVLVENLVAEKNIDAVIPADIENDFINQTNNNE